MRWPRVSQSQNADISNSARRPPSAARRPVFPLLPPLPTPLPPSAVATLCAAGLASMSDSLEEQEAALRSAKEDGDISVMEYVSTLQALRRQVARELEEEDATGDAALSSCSCSSSS